jgi:hypothetical protein
MENFTFQKSNMAPISMLGHMLWIRLKFSPTSCHIEVDVPNSVTTLNQTPIFELYVCGLVWLQEY